MSKVDPRDQKRLLAAVLKARQRARRLRAEAKTLQQEAVKAALSAGVSPLAIAAELNVTKARVYQLRDGR